MTRATVSIASARPQEAQRQAVIEHRQWAIAVPTSDQRAQDAQARHV
jgi:hypothetical protein